VHLLVILHEFKKHPKSLPQYFNMPHTAATTVSIGKIPESICIIQWYSLLSWQGEQETEHLCLGP